MTVIRCASPSCTARYDIVDLPPSPTMILWDRIARTGWTLVAFGDDGEMWCCPRCSK